MAESLTLKTNNEPTYFNKEALIGLLLFPPLGALIGGFMGKDRIERENTQGRIIKEPTMANKDALLGGTIGFYAGSLLGYLAAGALIAAGAFSLPFAAPELIILPAMAASIGGGLLGTLIGAKVGGDIGKEAMQLDRIAAEIQQAEEAKAKAPMRAAEHNQEHIVAKNHAKAISEERARAAQQEHTVTV